MSVAIKTECILLNGFIYPWMPVSFEPSIDTCTVCPILNLLFHTFYTPARYSFLPSLVIIHTQIFSCLHNHI